MRDGSFFSSFLLISVILLSMDIVCRFAREAILNEYHRENDRNKIRRQCYVVDALTDVCVCRLLLLIVDKKCNRRSFSSAMDFNGWIHE